MIIDADSIFLSRAYNQLNPKFCGRILTQNHGISSSFTLRTPEVDTRRRIVTIVVPNFKNRVVFGKAWF